jgi:hypothetical protein
LVHGEKGEGGGVSDILFMGQQDDPELANILGRGDVHVYGVNRTTTTPPEDWPRAEVRHNQDAGLWVQQRGGAFARCGCGQCFCGPCPTPRGER